MTSEFILKKSGGPNPQPPAPNPDRLKKYLYQGRSEVFVSGRGFKKIKITKGGPNPQPSAPNPDRLKKCLYQGRSEVFVSGRGFKKIKITKFLDLVHYQIAPRTMLYTLTLGFLDEIVFYPSAITAERAWRGRARAATQGHVTSPTWPPASSFLCTFRNHIDFS
ncbi:hypothetical protein EVAR_54522_1 [Eumeta japonica]|uniref:Uncharacterized protein n=1 Tax=Eumeta variegata TaxID=151549 RepID=A0A4C1YLB9_EUMVA|nr:hypothetical protein EVAR_54522_1 [Eumeta japonica]